MKQKKYNVVFLGKKDDDYSNRIVSYLKTKNIQLEVILSSVDKDKSVLKILNKKKIDFIFSFRSKFILSRNIIDSTKYFCINFHPGPPEFRGLECVNNAIFSKSSFYGLTAHIIDEYIDHGPIINVKRFSILANDGVEKILDKTYKKQIVQSKFIINNTLKNPDVIDKFIFKFKKEKWSKKISNKKKLNQLYLLDKDISNKKFSLSLNATLTKNFKPYIIIHKKRFILEDSRQNLNNNLNFFNYEKFMNKSFQHQENLKEIPHLKKNYLIDIHPAKNIFDRGFYTERDLNKLPFKYLGKNIKISKDCLIKGVKNISIKNNVRIDSYTSIIANIGSLKIGNDVHIGGHGHLLCAGDLIIENKCTLSQNVKIYSQTDDYSGKFSHGLFVKDKKKNYIKGKVKIGSGTIIGSGTVILPGVSIKGETSIGALSLVNKDINEVGIYGGIPCKKIKDKIK
jgi:acetyltransferase-like isoleucine patch superfamily enzyme/folate-dependent phosphoribosylglycinamide formyltransferase PurN